MGYRISYESKKHDWARWMSAGACAGAAVWCAFRLGPVWRDVGAGEGLYEALARFVGGLIRGH